MNWKTKCYSAPRWDQGENLIHIHLSFVEPAYGDPYAMDVLVEDNPLSIASAFEGIAAGLRRATEKLTL